MKYQRLAKAIPLDRRIITLRGERVILDADLAQIYGVTTKALNQAIQRNLERSPANHAKYAKNRSTDSLGPLETPFTWRVKPAGVANPQFTLSLSMFGVFSVVGGSTFQRIPLRLLCI